MDLKINVITDIDGYTRFKLDDTSTKKVTGIRSLVQIVAHALLSTPLTDIFRQDWLGGLQSRVPGAIDIRRINEYKSEIAQVVADVERQIKSEQSGYDLPDSERLVSIDILRIEFFPFDQRWELDVRVVSESGESVTLTV